VLGSGGEGGAADAEGPGGGGHGPVVSEGVADLVFGEGDPSWCWCQLFLGSSASDSAATGPGPDNRRALRQEIIHAAVPPGLLAFVKDQPVGWTRVGPRSDFPRLNGSRALAKVLTEDPRVWWVTCFAVDSRHRRSGVGTALLKAAVEFARENGATAVEGHPVDVAALTAARVGGSAVLPGPWRCFALRDSPRLHARAPAGR